MTKHERLIRDLLSRAGFRIVWIRQNGHFKARVARPDGSEATTIFPSSPSDGRWVRNKMVQLRALMEGRPKTAGH